MEETENIMRPCPICMMPMTVCKTSAVVDSYHRKWFFFLYCSQCGYGPNHAHDSICRAIETWNKMEVKSYPKYPYTAHEPRASTHPQMYL